MLNKFEIKNNLNKIYSKNICKKYLVEDIYYVISEYIQRNKNNY